MSFATISDVEYYLNIKDDSSAERLSFLLRKSWWVIEKEIGPILEWDRQELIELRQVLGGTDIFLRNINVTSISKINWKEYKGEYLKDYFILKPQGRRVRILDLQNYIGDSYGSGVVAVDYVSWYEKKSIPEDIKLAQCLYVAYYYMRDEGKDVVKYTLWPRTVQYDNSWEILTDIKQILNKYKQLNLLP